MRRWPRSAEGLLRQGAARARRTGASPQDGPGAELLLRARAAPAPGIGHPTSTGTTRTRRLAFTCVALAAGLSIAGGAVAHPKPAPTGLTPLQQAAKDVVAAGAVGYLTRVDDGRRVTELARSEERRVGKESRSARSP